MDREAAPGTTPPCSNILCNECRARRSQGIANEIVDFFDAAKGIPFPDDIKTKFTAALYALRNTIVLANAMHTGLEAQAAVIKALKGNVNMLQKMLDQTDTGESWK